MGAALVTVVRPDAAARLLGAPATSSRCCPSTGTAIGVRTDGLLYPLVDEDLPPGSTRGVSNELVAATAAVSLREGVLLAVQPGIAGTHQLRTP